MKLQDINLNSRGNAAMRNRNKEAAAAPNKIKITKTGKHYILSKTQKYIIGRIILAKKNPNFPASANGKREVETAKALADMGVITFKDLSEWGEVPTRNGWKREYNYEASIGENKNGYEIVE